MFFFFSESMYAHMELAFPEINSSVSKCSVKQRRDHLKRACLNEYGTTGFSVKQLSSKQLQDISKHILVDDEHKVMFCYVGKAGSTTYKSIFMQHSNKYKNQFGTREFGEIFRSEIAHSIDLQEKFGLRSMQYLKDSEKRIVLDNYYKVFATRNPFSRIHSMYQNKLIDTVKKKKMGKCFRYNKHLGMKIIEETRPKSEIENITCAVDVSFLEFATYYANHPEIKTDNHLIPVTDQCHTCFIDYDYYFKLKTGDSDHCFLVKELFKETGTPNDLVHLNAHDMNSEDIWRNNDFKQHIAAYDGISEDVLEHLRDIYRMDFILFGYNVTEKSTIECQIQLEDGSLCC